MLFIDDLKMNMIGTSNEPRHEPAFCNCENKEADQLRGNSRLISAFVFATLIAQSLYFLNTKFHTSSHIVWSYSLVCVGPGRKP